MPLNLRALRNERGIAMVYVVLVMMVMSSIAFVTLESIQHEQTTSYSQTNKQTAYQAAEAGIDDYYAKLNDDPQYYGHYVAAAESTRTDLLTSATVAAATGCTATSKPSAPTWPYATALPPASGGGPEWSYANGKDRWCQTVNGYEYNLQITPPTASAPTLTIVATGRKTGATNTRDYRVVQQVLTPNPITRYYRIVDGDIGFGSTTTTDGQVWSNGTITHSGIATADLWAVGSINGTVSMQNGSVKHPSQPTPINFSAFLNSITDIGRAAQVATPSPTYFDDSTRDVWKFVFSNAGSFTAQACDLTDGPDSGATPDPAGKTSPVTNCTSSQSYQMPTNGAIYSKQNAVVSGTVKGRVTVASSASIILGGALNPNIAGTDVIGLDAQVDLVIATYVPSTLSWNAAVLAQTGTWCTYQGSSSGVGGCSDSPNGDPTDNVTGSHSSMTFSGSSTTADGGDLTMFGSRTYGYDDNLKFLSPPWFPSLVKPWTTTLFRELPAT